MPWRRKVARQRVYERELTPRMRQASSRVAPRRRRSSIAAFTPCSRRPKNSLNALPRISSNSSQGVGRHHAHQRVILLVQDHDIRIVDIGTGELLRHLTLDPIRDYQPTGAPIGPKPKTKRTKP
jgi:hypothetical protein